MPIQSLCKPITNAPLPSVAVAIGGAAVITGVALFIISTSNFLLIGAIITPCGGGAFALGILGIYCQSPKKTPFEKALIKTKLIVARVAYEIFKEMNIDDEETKAQVKDFFERTIRQLERGEHAPFPSWFHTTKVEFLGTNPFKKIIDSKKIKPSGVASLMGAGVYVSSVVESDYGTCVIALDDQAVSTDADYMRHNQCSGRPEKSAVWAAVRTTVAIDTENVAYIAVDDLEDAAGILRDAKCKVPLISNKANDYIRNAFHQAYTDKEVGLRRSLPPMWTNHDNLGIQLDAFVEPTPKWT